MLKIAIQVLCISLICILAACDKTDLLSNHLLSCPDYIQQDGDKFVIKHGQLRILLTPMIGGRIASLKHGQHELLITPELSGSLLWGNVLWSSPQDDWGWPPVDVLDSNPYQIGVDDHELVFTSEVDPKTGYQFVKRYSVVEGAEALRITYRIYNRSDIAKDVAPWEVSRLATAGTVFFPKGDSGFDSSIFYPLQAETLDDVVWFTYDRKKLQDDHHKLMTDGEEGWLAYTHQGYLLVKQFSNVPLGSAAKGEGEIVLFVNAEKTYMEIEQQGVVKHLQPGEYLDWQVVWHVKKLPIDMEVKADREELVEFVRDLVDEVELY